MADSAEMRAYDRALKYVEADPFYTDKKITAREKALMMLAIRSYSYPVLTDHAIVRLTETDEEKNSGIRPCVSCGRRGPYRVRMSMDSLVAECQRCRTHIDIGHSAKGYDPDA